MVDDGSRGCESSDWNVLSVREEGGFYSAGSAPVHCYNMILQGMALGSDACRAPANFDGCWALLGCRILWVFLLHDHKFRSVRVSRARVRARKMPILRIHVKPNASVSRIVHIASATSTEATLDVAVAATPKDNEANEELVRFISKTLSIPKSSIQMIRGQTSRQKTLQIPDTATFLAQMQALALAQTDGRS